MTSKNRQNDRSASQDVKGGSYEIGQIAVSMTFANI